MPNRNTVLILAPFGRDAELLLGMLMSSDIQAKCIVEPSSLLDAVRSGRAGALMLTQEAFTPAFLALLTEALALQPDWSDLPVLVLVPGGMESPIIGRVEAALGGLPNVTFLERPIRPSTLASAARAALKSRARQYEVERVSKERDKASASLLESEKLAAVGRLASSIAHELNNPLESITNLIYIVRNDPNLSADSQAHLDLASSELQRAAEITKQNLRFHRQSTRPVSITAEELFVPILALYKGRLANSSIDVITDFRGDSRVVCYEGEIRQVLSNLIGNAIDAMRTGGTLKIRCSCSLDWRTGANGLSILVADSGHGMSDEVRRRIFEAFYSTKGIGGTGLGLWVSSEIISKHKGHLRVRSTVGTRRQGTSFRLFLPDSAHEDDGQQTQ